MPQHAYVLFLDVVGYSQRSIEEQSEIVRHLHDASRHIHPFRVAYENKEAIWTGSGDGFALVFFTNLVGPIECAPTLQKLLGSGGSVRIGLHSGIVERGTLDPNRNEQVIGDGINMAARVMDEAGPGDILLSGAYADELRSLGESYRSNLVDLPEATVKHDVKLRLARWTSRERQTKVALLYKRHAVPDQQIVNGTYDYLCSKGLDVFIDKDMPAGTHWAAEIENKVRSADIVIPFLSDRSIGSEMMETELKIAYDSNQGNKSSPRILPVRVAYKEPLPEPFAAVLDQLQYVLWESPSDDAKLHEALWRGIQSAPAPLKPEDVPTGTGAMPIDSAFYVERADDSRFMSAIRRHERIVLVKGARQVGKTSLLARGLQQAKDDGATVAMTDYQVLNEDCFSSLKEFYIALSFEFARKLGLKLKPRDFWDDEIPENQNFEDFLEEQLLPKVPDWVVWVMDEVDRLFTTSFGNQVFALFRNWYQIPALYPERPLAKVCLVMSYATEAQLFISDLNQSPFNVGTHCALEDFSRDQVSDLNQRYGAPLSSQEIDVLLQLFGGHPFLIQRSLISLVNQETTIKTLETTADRDEGVFGDHLRRILLLLARDKKMTEAVKAMLNSKPVPDERTFARLRAAGLISGRTREKCQFRCGIYRAYLERHLND